MSGNRTIVFDGKSYVVLSLNEYNELRDGAKAFKQALRLVKRWSSSNELDIELDKEYLRPLAMELLKNYTPADGHEIVVKDFDSWYGLSATIASIYPKEVPEETNSTE